MTPSFLLSLALVVFFIGLFGVLFRRNFIVVLMSLELMLNAANFALVVVSQTFGEMGVEGHFLVLMVLMIAAVEVSIGLALAVHMYRTGESVDVEEFNRLPR